MSIPLEHHRDVTGGWLRPAVFGAMDGLVSNFALMAGVAGGTAGLADGNRSAVVLAGLAGLAAGAFSMAAGEYTSVASQSELAEQEFENERRELSRNPDAEAKELAEIWVSRGIDRELAVEMASQLAKNPDAALEVHAREELGMAPGELPNPWLAAGSSFLSFVAGAMIPVLPYAFGATTLTWSLVLSLMGLFAAGAVVSRVTARSWWFSGLRQLFVGAAAAAVTFGVGSLVGTSIS
ncbi:VIT1/CCC1 transporter family protein [Longivirga aurantiaca]|uniref:VIT1/CCC1 transporter family protein n=1 Tax=Longivirga aurantiaca TaxID=1837743 RepID=A0ABW1T302_9ACTN